MKLLKNRRGITLIELITAFALLGIVLMVGYSFFSTGLKSYGSQIDNADNQAIARQAIRHISTEIRKAEEIEIVDESSIKLDGIMYSFDDSTNILSRDGKDFITGIKLFKVRPGNEDDDNPEANIKIEVTTLGNDGQEFTLSSSIFIRE